jgi:hypothetical protein
VTQLLLTPENAKDWRTECGIRVVKADQFLGDSANVTFEDEWLNSRDWYMSTNGEMCGFPDDKIVYDPLPQARPAEPFKTPVYEGTGEFNFPTEKGFYAVWTPFAGYATERYESAERAYERIDDISKLNPGVTFYVLRAVTRQVTQVRHDTETVPLT